MERNNTSDLPVGIGIYLTFSPWLDHYHRGARLSSALARIRP